MQLRNIHYNKAAERLLPCEYEREKDVFQKKKKKTASEKLNNIFPHSKSSYKRWVKVGGHMIEELHVVL